LQTQILFFVIAQFTLEIDPSERQSILLTTLITSLTSIDFVGLPDSHMLHQVGIWLGKKYEILFFQTFSELARQNLEWSVR
jgi:hypothetical protein